MKIKQKVPRVLTESEVIWSADDGLALLACPDTSHPAITASSEGGWRYFMVV